jgi:hypothetical protein
MSTYTKSGSGSRTETSGGNNLAMAKKLAALESRIKSMEGEMYKLRVRLNRAEHRNGDFDFESGGDMGGFQLNNSFYINPDNTSNCKAPREMLPGQRGMSSSARLA